jgi:ABC-type transporter Mla subunit MlaD
MAIFDIEAGSKASSKQVNDNFHYLQDLVGELSLKIDGSEDTVDSKIATLKNTLTNQINDLQTNIETEQETLQNNIDTLADGVGKSVAYIVKSYVNGTSGYVVYNNDLKIQWGQLTHSGGADRYYGVTFLIPFNEANYIVAGSWSAMPKVGDKGLMWSCRNRYKNYVEIGADTASSNSQSANIYWIAIGY